MSNPNIQKIREQLAKPKTVTGPSGMTYQVRRLTPMDYIKEGLSDIPNDFFVFVLELGQNASKLSEMSEEERRKNLELFENFLSVTVSKGIVDPPTILRWDKEKEDTHLLWSEIPAKDQEYLMGCIQGRIDPDDETLVQRPEGSGGPKEEKKTPTA